MAALTASNSETRSIHGLHEAFNQTATALLISTMAGMAFILQGFVSCPRLFASAALGTLLVSMFVLVSG